MLSYPIAIGPDALQELKVWLDTKSYPKILVLVDEHTDVLCYPKLAPFLPAHEVYQIDSGEINKTLETCVSIWQRLTELQFGRKDLLINLGGGVIGDMGGFVAGTYKRGIDFVQVPTTLLSQVDASVGGKLGIDFQGYKNHIGLFGEPQGVYIFPEFLQTLSKRELTSGFAEIIKHHLIADLSAWQDLQSVKNLEPRSMAKLIQHSVDIKSRIVAQDYREQGARKALNFGHTIGHAVERYYLEQPEPILHGEAVALGIICESWLSVQKGLLKEAHLVDICTYIFRFYGGIQLSPSLYPELIQNMHQDKKNQQGEIRCSLIKGPGSFEVDVMITEEEAWQALDYYCEVSSIIDD